jgi:hypothetical protein
MILLTNFGTQVFCVAIAIMPMIISMSKKILMAFIMLFFYHERRVDRRTLIAAEVISAHVAMSPVSNDGREVV